MKTSNSPDSIVHLPDLTPANVDINAPNIRAVEAIYLAHMLEEMRVPQVVDRIVELFRQGRLPIGHGRAGSLLYSYWKGTAERLREDERRDLYHRVFGVPSGSPASEVTPNREFNDLWIRFLAAVSAYARQLDAPTKVPPDNTATVGQEDLRRSGRDLAANLSLHGSGMAFYVAKELQSEIRSIIVLLADPEIHSAFGARDMWQLVDQISTTYLGGARSTARYRAQASSGTTIIRWLSNHATRLARPRPVIILDDEIIRRRRVAVGNAASSSPTDYDLVKAVEAWLAAALRGGPGTTSDPDPRRAGSTHKRLACAKRP